MKRVVKALFSFSKKELNGILVLLIVLILILAATLLLPNFISPPKADFTLAAKELAAIDKNRKDTFMRPVATEITEAAPKPELFYFDPNTANFSQLTALGLQEKVIDNLLKYRSNGGFFKTKEELKKIYGLTASEYNRIAPFVSIKREREVSNRSNENKGDFGIVAAKSESYPASTAENIRKKIEINSADTTALKSLPGIGTVLSTRIVKFRERLGGFCSISQLKEVYGLKEETFNIIKPMLNINAALVQKINVNQATADELSRLPYWSKTQVKALVAYRSQHGAFSSIRDMGNIKALDSVQIQKIMPYLSF